MFLFPDHILIFQCGFDLTKQVKNMAVFTPEDYPFGVEVHFKSNGSVSVNCYPIGTSYFSPKENKFS
jgi:hypothetical protein